MQGSHPRPLQPPGSGLTPRGQDSHPRPLQSPGSGLTPRVRGSQIPAGKACQTRRSAATSRRQNCGSQRRAKGCRATAWQTPQQLPGEMTPAHVTVNGKRGASRGGRGFEGSRTTGEQSAPPARARAEGRPRKGPQHGFLRDRRVLGVAAGRQRRAPAERLGVPET